MDGMRDPVDGFLRRFGATGKSADAIRHAEEHRALVEQKSVFVFSANTADVGERGGAKR